MSNREYKRRRTLQRRRTAYRPVRLIFTPEDKAWLDMRPVGREFGDRGFYGPSEKCSSARMHWRTRSVMPAQKYAWPTNYRNEGEHGLQTLD